MKKNKNLSSVQKRWQFSSHSTKPPSSQKNCQEQPPADMGKRPILGEERTNGLPKTQTVKRQQVLTAAENNPAILKHIIKTRSRYHPDGCTMTHVKPAYGPSAVPKDQVSTLQQLLSRPARSRRGRHPDAHAQPRRVRGRTA